MKRISTVTIFLLISLFVTGQAKYRSITWEKFKISGPALKQVGWLEPTHAKDIKSSIWSVGCETLDRNQARFDVYKDFVGELGVKHARLQSGWSKCEKQKGVYNFAWLDSCVYGLVEQGVNPWICLCYGNSLYRSEVDLGADLFTAEETMAGWCRYVEATVARYKGVVKEWEIWNEPRHRASTEAYANLMIRTSEAIRKVQPDATIMGFTVHGFSPGVVVKFPAAVLEILKQKNKLDIVDYVTYHPYTKNPDDCYPMVDELKELFHSYNPKIKFYQGESGCPSILEWGHALTEYPWTEYSQAKWVMRRMAGDMIRDIRSSVFTIIDLRYKEMLQSFGLIRSNLLREFIYKRPSYYGAQNMAGFFSGELKSLGELKYESTSSRKLTVAGMKTENGKVAIIWYGDKVPIDDLKWDLIDLKVKGLSFKDPIYIEMITGKVFELDKGNWQCNNNSLELKSFPVWDSPVVIAERSQVSLKKDSK